MPNPIEGPCANCGRGIPWGYLAIVTKWEVLDRGTMRVQVPAKMFCRNEPCAEEARKERKNHV